MIFKNDKQRRAVFANMNKFSVASAVVNLFPGDDIDVDVVGLTSFGIDKERSQWDNLFRGNRFSDDSSSLEVVNDVSSDMDTKPVDIITDAEQTKIMDDGLEDLANATVNQEVEYDDVTYQGMPKGEIIYQDDFKSSGVAGDVSESVSNDGFQRAELGQASAQKSGDVTFQKLKAKQAAEDIVYGNRRDVREEAKRNLVRAFEGDIEELATEVGRLPRKGLERAVHLPSDISSSIGSGVKRTAKAVGKGVYPALKRGAITFGATAGGAVSGAIAETSDLFEGPRREYRMPPGTQRVYEWGTGRYRTAAIPERPIPPFVSQFGYNRVPGVDVRREDYAAAQEVMNRGLYGMTGAEAASAFEDKSRRRVNYGPVSRGVPNVAKPQRIKYLDRARTPGISSAYGRIGGGL